MNCFYKILLFCLPIFLNAQEGYYPVSFLITDSESSMPLENAMIAVKEIGFQALKSGYDGKVVFESIPQGEINYIVTLEGYQGVEGSINATAEIKSNTVLVKLLKIPSPKAAMVLIAGEVLDKNNVEVEGADVELRLGRIVKTAKTDKSGNFNVEINLDDLVYQDNDIDIEIKFNDCVSRDKISIPKSNYVHRLIKIDCEITEPGTETAGGDGIVGANIAEVQDVRFTLLKVFKRRDKVICEFTMTNLDSREREKEISINAGRGKVIDNNGIECNDNLVQIGSKIDKEIGRVPAYGKLPYNVPIKSRLEFPICDLESNFGKGISFLQINCNRNESLQAGFYNVVVESN